MENYQPEFLEMRFDMFYFGCDFFYCCPHLYFDQLKYNVSAAVSSGLSRMSLVYLSIEYNIFLNKKNVSYSP